MNFRYKNKDWQKAYIASRKRLKVFVSGDGCESAVAYEAQLMLKAYFRGPWRMVAAIIKRELRSMWNCYAWPKWEWIRVKVFRGKHCEALEAYERAVREANEVERVASEL